MHTEHAPENQNTSTLRKPGPTVRRLFPTEPARPDALATRPAPTSSGPAATRPAPPVDADLASTATPADGFAHIDAAVKRAAHGVIRIAFEVIDGRRPPERARGVFTEPIVDMLRVLARESVPGRKLGPARVQRVHSDRIDVHRDDSIIPYEISATYARGPRVFALAARLEVKGDRTRCTAIRLI